MRRRGGGGEAGSQPSLSACLLPLQDRRKESCSKQENGSEGSEYIQIN